MMQFFFYGTLLALAQTRMSRWMAPKIVHSAPATARGRLLAIPAGGGWYPAMLRGGTSRVVGTVCTLRLGTGDLARLDRYEGKNYRRAKIELTSRSNARKTAMTYLWNGALPAGARPVPEGDFLAWLEKTGKGAFGE